MVMKGRELSKLASGLGYGCGELDGSNFCRALALAMAARPNEVGSAVFAMADLLHLLDYESSHIMTRRVMHSI